MQFSFSWICSWLQIESLWVQKTVYAGAQYLITYGFMRRALHLPLLRNKPDKELYGVGIFFSMGFLLITIYRTTADMPLYVGEVMGYLLEAFLLIALLEELVFRGMISQVLGERCVVSKVMVSTAVFTLMHYVSWMPEIFAFEVKEICILLFSPLILGILLATLYEIKKDVGLTTIVHGTYNVLSLVSYGNVRIAMCLCYILFVIAYSVYCKKKGSSNEKNHGLLACAGTDNE